MPDLTVVPAELRPIEVIENRNRTVIVDQDTTKGQLLYRKANTRAGIARGNAVGTSKLLGVATSDASTGYPVECLYFGRIAGFDVSGLDTGTAVFLSAATAGAIADTAPSGTGNVVVPIGTVDCYTNPAKTKFLFIDIPQNATPVAL